MQIELQKDIGEEIIMKLRELESKIIKLLKIKNEKELSNTSVPGNRS